MKALKWLVSLCGLLAFAWIDKNWFDYQFSILVFVCVAVFSVLTATLIEGFFRKLGLFVLFLLLLAAPALAQQKKAAPLWTWEDGALAASFAADEISTRYALESCPRCRESSIATDYRARIAIKGGLFAAFKLWEWKRPDDRGKLRWLKRGAIGFFVVATINNLVRAKR